MFYACVCVCVILGALCSWQSSRAGWGVCVFVCQCEKRSSRDAITSYWALFHITHPSTINSGFDQCSWWLFVELQRCITATWEQWLTHFWKGYQIWDHSLFLSKGMEAYDGYRHKTNVCDNALTKREHGSLSGCLDKSVFYLRFPKYSGTVVSWSLNGWSYSACDVIVSTYAFWLKQHLCSFTQWTINSMPGAEEDQLVIIWNLSGQNCPTHNFTSRSSCFSLLFCEIYSN